MLLERTPMQRQVFSLEVSAPPQCCICLDEFNNPVSLPCGHCFCLECIGECWRIQEAFQCPLCKAIFPVRPCLKTHSTAPSSGSNTSLKAGEVPCDICQSKHPAVKSCLVCLASYCGHHLEPHYQDEALWRHPLVSVVKNLEDSMCRLHGKQLERFCRSDQTCICVMCAQTEHRGHHVVSISNEVAKKKIKLKRLRAKLQRAIEEKQNEVKKLDPEEENKGIKQLRDEIDELQRRNTELEQLGQTGNNLNFLQRFQHGGF